MSHDFERLSPHKKRIVNRQTRLNHIESKMIDDPDYRPRHYNAKISYEDVEVIRRLFNEIPKGKSYSKKRGDFVKQMSQLYDISKASIWRYVAKTSRIKNTDQPSFNELKKQMIFERKKI